MTIFNLQLYTKYSWYLWYLAAVCHNQTIYFSASCQSKALNNLLAYQDYVTTQWDIDHISKASLTFNQLFYYLLEMCCNGTLHQKHKYSKNEIFPTEPQQCIQHLTLGWKWYHQPFNAEILSTSCYTQNSKISFKEILPFFSQIHEMTSPAIWNHPSNLISFCPKQTAVLWQLYHDSCHSFSW